MKIALLNVNTPLVITASSSKFVTSSSVQQAKGVTQVTSDIGTRALESGPPRR